MLRSLYLFIALLEQFFSIFARGLDWVNHTKERTASKHKKRCGNTAKMPSSPGFPDPLCQKLIFTVTSPHVQIYLLIYPILDTHYISCLSTSCFPLEQLFDSDAPLTANRDRGYCVRAYVACRSIMHGICSATFLLSFIVYHGHGRV